MTKISNWAALASVAIGVMATGCTVTTSDDTDGGGLGTGGTNATGGTGGSAGVDSGTSGSGGSAGTATTSDAAADAFVPMGACEVCVYTSTCRSDADACRADTVNGCADALDDFYTCLASGSGDSVSDCGTQFTSDAQAKGGDAALTAAGLANTLASCVMDLPCVTSCRTNDGG